MSRNGGCDFRDDGRPAGRQSSQRFAGIADSRPLGIGNPKKPVDLTVRRALENAWSPGVWSLAVVHP